MQVDKQAWTLVIKDKMKGVKQSMWLELDEHHLAHNCTFQAVKAVYEFVASGKLEITDKTKTLFANAAQKTYTGNYIYHEVIPQREAKP